MRQCKGMRRVELPEAEQGDLADLVDPQLHGWRFVWGNKPHCLGQILSSFQGDELTPCHSVILFLFEIIWAEYSEYFKLCSTLEPRTVQFDRQKNFDLFGQTHSGLQESGSLVSLKAVEFFASEVLWPKLRREYPLLGSPGVMGFVEVWKPSCSSLTGFPSGSSWQERQDEAGYWETVVSWWWLILCLQPVSRWSLKPPIRLAYR